MKKLIVVLLITATLCCTALCTPVGATSVSEATTTTVEYLDNGDYIETIITYDNSLTRSTKTASKTSNYKNSSGDILWSVTVKGTFTYNGTTSSCTSCSHSTTAPGTYWSIKSSSSSKSGNTATATAVATYKTALITKDYSMSVKLTCSADGTLS